MAFVLACIPIHLFKRSFNQFNQKNTKMKTLVKNKKAYFEYTIIEKYVAGIELVGSEVKSIRNGKANIEDSYCFVEGKEVFVKNMHISEHKEGGKANNHVPVRDRKLLLKKREIFTLDDKVKQKGLTLVPLQLVLTERGFIKLEIALAKGKKIYDKKETLKLRDLDRELKRDM
jgi:SsrA-binding protein